MQPPNQPLFAGKCKQSYSARKAQEGLSECQSRLEIYGGGGKCIPAGNADAIWRGICKESHRQSGSSKGHQEDNLLKARGKTSKLFFRIPPPESAGRPQGWFQKRLREIPAILAEDHSSLRTKQPRTEKQLETSPVQCLVKNTVCQPTLQVGANRQYQLQ